MFFLDSPWINHDISIFKKNQKNIHFDSRKLWHQKRSLFCVFLMKKSQKGNALEVQKHFFHFFHFFQQLTSSGISIKTFKKERKNVFFSILIKSGLFWRNPLAIPLFYVVKIMKSDSLLLP